MKNKSNRKRQLNHILKTTEDGSNTFYVPELDEHYHSTFGAIQESTHIFIKAGLHYCVNQNIPKEINILEIGFGTGLNALLTLLETKKNDLKVLYHTLELYPVSKKDTEKLNFTRLLSSNNSSETDKSVLFSKLHSSTWGKAVNITPDFTLLKQNIDFSIPSSFKTYRKYNLVYFDAFAPEKQPEMWTQEIFDTIYSLCKERAVITTYCAKGAVRRMLQSSGFKVERLPGPPGKREILRGSTV